MCSKASMAPAPLVVLLCDRAFESESFGEALRRHKWLYAGLASSWLVLALLVWMAPRSTVGASDVIGWPLYLVNQARVVGHYLRLVVWPRGLVLDYGLPRALTIGDVWVQALVILGLAGVAVMGWRRWPAAGFAGVVFFLMLAPTSSVIPITSEVGAERRMYVPMMALVALATSAGWFCLDHLRRRAPGFARPVTWSAVALTIGLATALGAATIERNALFRDPVALWRDTIERWPHSRARLSLASALIEAGRGSEAIPELRLAARDYPDAKYALGAALHRTGQLDEAIAVLNEFIAARASDASLVPARSELGKAYASQKKFDQAAAQYRAILEMAPSDRDARERLGDMLLSAARYEDAAAELSRVVQEVSRPDLELKLAVALMRANHPDAAVSHLERVLALDPRSADAHRNLAEIAWERGEVEPAVRHAEAALGIDSRNAGTHNFLGVVLASSGRVREAIAHFQRALEIEPGNTRARDNLARAEREVAGR
jgi:protein O-mannosyl-transferase